MKRILSVFAVFSFVLSVFAGGGQEEAPMAAAEDDPFAWIIESEDGVLPGVNVLDVKGNIVTAGSSTVFPLSEVMAQRFQDEGFPGVITVDSIGSGAGFERFTKTGETDISNASRPIKDSEVAQAADIGRYPIPFRVGTDALAVTVSKDNDFLEDVTIEELAIIFTSDMWSDVNPAWPAEEIIKFIPGTDSGTFDYFVEEVFDKDPAPLLNSENVQLSEDDNILVQGIEGSPYAVGFFGYAYYVENQEQLKILDINSVTASTEAVEQGTYALARPLFIYSDATIMKEKPQVAAFIAFYLTYVNEEIDKVGYFPSNDAVLLEAKQSWLTAMEGAY